MKGDGREEGAFMHYFAWAYTLKMTLRQCCKQGFIQEGGETRHALWFNPQIKGSIFFWRVCQTSWSSELLVEGLSLTFISMKCCL